MKGTKRRVAATVGTHVAGHCCTAPVEGSSPQSTSPCSCSCSSSSAVAQPPSAVVAALIPANAVSPLLFSHFSRPEVTTAMYLSGLPPRETCRLCLILVQPSNVATTARVDIPLNTCRISADSQEKRPILIFGQCLVIRAMCRKIMDRMVENTSLKSTP